jgi:hypothetical protein
MNAEFLNKISNLTFYGFYDPSKKLITVHFFNEHENKPDIIAYLLPSMTWDVREIVNESSTLYPDCEVITISHKCLGIENCGSPFDEFVRLGLEKLAREVHGKDVGLSKIDRMFEILENNEYK